MVKSYADRAKNLERTALSKRHASMHAKNSSLKDSLLGEAVNWYVEAGKTWILESKENELYPRRMKYARLNAIHDFGLAKKLRKEVGRQGLEKQVYVPVSIACLIGALFFISFNATGNSIGNFTRNDLSLLGTGLFVLGLVAFLLFKSRKK